jgi:phage terminase small subunit
MGLRGRIPTPTAIRVLNGNPSRRPLPTNEPQYTTGVPERPTGMSAGARKVWDGLISEMAASGVLRLVEAGALTMLCEDIALLETFRKGLAQMAREIVAQAKKQGKKIVGGPMVHLSRTIEGRRTLATIRELSAQIIVQRREFGLTPASNSRVEGGFGAGGGFMDPIEAALCGSDDETSLPN